MIHEHHTPEMLQKAVRVSELMRQMRTHRGMSGTDMRKDDRKQGMEETPIRLNKALGKNK